MKKRDIENVSESSMAAIAENGIKSRKAGGEKTEQLAEDGLRARARRRARKLLPSVSEMVGGGRKPLTSGKARNMREKREEYM